MGTLLMKMKKIIYVLILLIPSGYSYSQVVKDLDGDAVIDSVFIDNESRIVCKLSSKNFVAVKTVELESDGTVEIHETKNGFEYSTSFMRAGFDHQFRYDAHTQKIQLIGMSRYEFGSASNDGSGKSSVNLLTNDYIGEWHHYILKKEKLVKLPTIKTKMVFEPIYLENYNGSCQSEYESKCVELYYAEKKKLTD